MEASSVGWTDISSIIRDAVGVGCGKPSGRDKVLCLMKSGLQEVVVMQAERNETGTLFCSADLNDSELAFAKPAKSSL